jgi:phasin family protein
MKPEQFTAAGKASVDTLFDLSGQAFHGAEQLARLNLQTIKTLLAESQETGQSALSAKSPAELIELQSAALQAAPQKALAYGRQVQEILATLNAAQCAAFEAQIADAQAKFLDTVNGFFSTAPGSEQFLAFAKSAVDAASNVYGGMNKASKQVSDAVVANVAKVSESVAETPSKTLAKVED